VILGVILFFLHWGIGEKVADKPVLITLPDQYLGVKSGLIITLTLLALSFRILLTVQCETIIKITMATAVATLCLLYIHILNIKNYPPFWATLDKDKFEKYETCILLELFHLAVVLQHGYSSILRRILLQRTLTEDEDQYFSIVNKPLFRWRYLIRSFPLYSQQLLEKDKFDKAKKALEKSLVISGNTSLFDQAIAALMLHRDLEAQSLFQAIDPKKGFPQKRLYGELRKSVNTTPFQGDRLRTLIKRQSYLKPLAIIITITIYSVYFTFIGLMINGVLRYSHIYEQIKCWGLAETIRFHSLKSNYNKLIFSELDKVCDSTRENSDDLKILAAKQCFAEKYSKRGEYDEAIDNYRNILTILQRQPRGLWFFKADTCWSIALLQYKKKDLKEALKPQTKALEFFSKNVSQYDTDYHMACIFQIRLQLKIKEMEAARKSLLNLYETICKVNCCSPEIATYIVELLNQAEFQNDEMTLAMMERILEISDNETRYLICQYVLYYP
jgi:tetratricopeptide (TPR) repeat protein